MSQPPDLSICIVNWNTAGLLRECLQSILGESWKSSLEMIVVDNDSSDSSASIVQDEFPNVNLIANSENVGFARANNQAFAASSGRYILVLNSDTVILPNSLDIIVGFMDIHPETGAAGCKLLNRDGSVQRSCWRNFPNVKTAVVDAFFLWKLFPAWPWIRGSEISVEEQESVLEVDHLLGAFIVVRREVLDSVGGMDESIFLFYEETDWCYRIKRDGWRIHYVPSAKIIHIGQQSIRKNPEVTLPLMYNGHVWFFRKHENPNKLQILTLKLVILLASLIRLCMWTLRRYFTSNTELSGRMRGGYWSTIKQLPTY